jgi:two-component system, NtrC family, response regulator AtoC
VILARGEIEASHLNLEAGLAPDAGLLEGAVLSGKGALRESERETIRGVLAEVGGNRRRAAQILGISLRTLQYRIKEYGL